MALFHRRDVPPADALAGLGRDERVVSWADTEAGSVVLATPRGLWWPDEGAAAALRLIAWQHVSKATWRDGVLAITQADVADDLLMVDRRPVAVRLSVPRDLPPTVRKRVEANIVRSELEPVTGGAARIVARRVPGEDGLHWWARLEPGTADTAQVRSALAARVASLRADWERERLDQDW
jgi:hypothetical protein